MTAPGPGVVAQLLGDGVAAVVVAVVGGATAIFAKLISNRAERAGETLRASLEAARSTVAAQEALYSGWAGLSDDLREDRELLRAELGRLHDSAQGAIEQAASCGVALAACRLECGRLRSELETLRGD